MKKVLSLILAMAIILSCFVTGMVFSVNADTEYLDVSCLSGNNWNIANKLGLNGTTYPNNDSAVGVAYTGSKTYHAEPGENYEGNYENKAFHYSGTYIFSSNTNEVFINDETTPQYFRYQAQLAATEENSVIIYVELPDYVAQNEDWGLGFYRPADAIGEFRNASGYCRFFKRTENITEGFSYLSVDGKKWENGIIYAQADGEKVMKTDLPSGFKGYIRLDLSKINTVAGDGTTVMNDITTLHELDFAFNAVGSGDFVVGGLMYAVSNSDSTVLNFNGNGYCQLANIDEHIKVLGMAGYESYMDTYAARIKKISSAAVNGSVEGLETAFSINKNRQEAGQPYTALYNLADGTADTTNSDLVAKCDGVYEVKSKNGTYICDTAAPEAFAYQTKLKATTENAVIVYVELPDYEANGTDWGFGLARRGDGSLAYVAEFNNSSNYQRYFKRTVNNTTGFSYLPVDEDEWVNGTVYAEETGSRVMKTDLPSGFKGYIRFDLSKFNYVNGNGVDVSSEIVKLIELNFAYNGVTETDILSVGGLMYITTPNDANVLNFKYAGYVPMTNNILSIRAQNIITDTANETNATGTNLQVAKGGNEASATAVMSYGKSGGLFLDDGYAASFKPNGTVGNGIMMGVNRQYYNTVADENLNLQLKAGVNKFMFYVELPDVRDFEGITDEHSALATQAIYFTNGGYVLPYGLTYEYMDIRDGVWHESIITSDSTGVKNGVFSGLPTDGFKGYIKMDLNGLVASQTTTYTIKSIKLAINRFSWGRPLVIGGFYAIDVDSSAIKPYFIDTNTGEMATTEIVPCDFTGDNVINAADLTIAIKYLIDHPDVTGIQASRAVSLTEAKGKFTTVTLVQMKKILTGNFTPSYPPVIEDIEQYLPTDMTLSDKTLEFVGRYSTTNSSSYKLAWSGSTIKTAFVGTQLAATFKSSYSDYDYLQIYVDGERVETPLAITNTATKYTIAKDLEFGYHYVEIVKRSDAVRSYITFDGFDYKDGAAAPVPANKDRIIEFIGDSITAGWGNLSPSSTLTYVNRETDATQSYAYLTAKKLNADPIMLGMSGGGVAYNNDNTVGRIPTLWTSKAYTYDSSSIDFTTVKAPDVVVINVGTNDWSVNVTEDAYKTAYKNLVKDVRSKYPDAFILCTIGSMTTEHYDWIEAVVNDLLAENTETADSLAFYKIQVSTSEAGMKGGGGHPSAACHEVMAEEITAVLKEKLGW